MILALGQTRPFEVGIFAWDLDNVLTMVKSGVRDEDVMDVPHAKLGWSLCFSTL